LLFKKSQYPFIIKKHKSLKINRINFFSLERGYCHASHKAILPQTMNKKNYIFKAQNLGLLAVTNNKIDVILAHLME
jgi:hypothetical protein